MTADERALLTEKYGGKETPEFQADCNRLAKGEPVAYVIGYQPFLGLKIYLDSHPLIPRPETEWWTEQLVNKLESRSDAHERRTTRCDNFAQPCGADQKLSHSCGAGNERASALHVLDLCAGSGAIGCALLARLPNTRVYFGEIDSAHKATIEKNIRENNLDASRAHIGIGDLFEPFGDMTFDVIAANPPYIPTERILEKSVTEHEPALALRSGADGLALIRRIAKELPNHLTQTGVAWIECDTKHAAAAAACFEEQGFHTEIRTDQYKRARLIVVSFE